MDNEYILSFSSFYKAAYARDVLDESGINSVLRKLPSELVKSCSTGLYLRIDSIQRARQIFEEKPLCREAYIRLEEMARQEAE